MMNGSEQWDDSMSLDNTRINEMKMVQQNIIKFYEKNKPLNRSELYPKQWLNGFSPIRTFKNIQITFYVSVQIIICNQDK